MRDLLLHGAPWEVLPDDRPRVEAAARKYSRDPRTSQRGSATTSRGCGCLERNPSPSRSPSYSRRAGREPPRHLEVGRCIACSEFAEPAALIKVIDTRSGATFYVHRPSVAGQCFRDGTPSARTHLIRATTPAANKEPTS
jgi:hypothetical protein